MEGRPKAAWSMENYTIHDVVYKMGLPRTVRVTEGVYSQNEQESLSTGDIVRLDAISEIKRIVTRANLMDEEVTDLQIPLNFQGEVYVYTGKETVYKSVQELIQLFPGYVHVDSPIKAVSLENNNEEEVDLGWGACLKLDRVVSGQGLHCTYCERKICLRPFQRGRFSRIPKNDIMYLKDVIRNFSLPVNVRFMDKLPELNAVLDTNKVSHFSLERVESLVAIVGSVLNSDGSKVSANQLMIALTQATDVEVQVSLTEEKKSMLDSPKNSPQTAKKRPPPVPKRSSSIPSSFGKSLPLQSTLYQQDTSTMTEKAKVASVTPQPPNGGFKSMLTNILRQKPPSLPPRKMSNPETFTHTRRGSVDTGPENRLCAVPPLPSRNRSRPPSDDTHDLAPASTSLSRSPDVAKKLETVTLNKLPPNIGRELFNNSSINGDRISKSSTPTRPLSTTSKTDSSHDSESSEGPNEADYISMEDAKEIKKQIKPPSHRTPPVPPPRDRGSSSSQKLFPPDSLPVTNSDYTVSASQQDHPGYTDQKVPPDAFPRGRLVSPQRDRRAAFTSPRSSVKRGLVPDPQATEDMGVVTRHPLAVFSPSASQNLDEYYSSIPKNYRQSLLLVHKELVSRQYESPQKPTGAVSPISRFPSPPVPNFSNLSVAETVHCFRDCRLNDLADLCEKEGLDGCFIDKLTNADLSRDPFNLSVLHRMKVEQIKQGWRPFYN
ncbi:uncharacterized protein LOC133200737 [Saccostrea echinata]|uniref:uncharacterized protein LOC133200737 n=1 Tax=Saccostrea echinata TaxID=191078 RepID=UPI002A7EA671|nr:uncharacterized protein LOC133200737 [Saccostrea echinata]